MEEQSPYVTKSSTAAPTAPAATSTAPAPAAASSSSFCLTTCLVWAVVVILAIVAMYLLYNRMCGDGFLVNTVKSDPASDWSLKSEIEKLVRMQEDYLAKRPK